MTFENQNISEILQKKGAKIYFIGIGGIGMSAAANLAHESGYVVSGSDSSQIYSPAKEVLEDNDIPYYIGYKKEQVESAFADLYILSAGETELNPEVAYVVANNLPKCGFAELLYELSKDCLRLVVTGTHGKSTTSGLIGHVLKNLDNSSFLVGAVLQNYNSNFHSGNGHYFVFEGDEYKNLYDDPTPKFHYYKPDILVLNNLEHDHPDIFPDFEDLKKEFEYLISNMPEDGLIVYNADNEVLVKLIHQTNVTAVSFALENEADFKVENIEFADYTSISIKNRFAKKQNGNLQAIFEPYENYKIQLPGKINVYNSVAAIATLRTLGFKQEDLALEILSYAGVKRRFEIVGKKNGIVVIDDYAHHPTAVKETLDAAKIKYPEAKVWAVFEPHTFSRTKSTLDLLVKSFDSADQVLISEIYPAREKVSEANITSEHVVESVSKFHKNVRLVKTKDEAKDIIKKQAQPGDVVIVMAVGSFYKLAYELIEVL